MLEKLKEEVYKANLELVKRNLVIGWYRSAVVSAVISVSSSADLERPLYSQVFHECVYFSVHLG